MRSYSYNCGKRRCIYSPSDAVYIGAITALQQKLESVSDRFSCGDLIFEDDDPLSKAVVQKKNLTCETRIERGYYNHRERALKLRALCVHCGEHGPTGTFLLVMSRNCISNVASASEERKKR